MLFMLRCSPCLEHSLGDDSDVFMTLALFLQRCLDILADQWLHRAAQ